jgi:hypothetical protein
MSKQLPPHPSLKQLKNQAKDLRRAHQSADPDALERIRAHLPRLPEATDEQLRGAEITLQDCQHVIAREYEFESWNWVSWSKRWRRCSKRRPVRPKRATGRSLRPS